MDKVSEKEIQKSILDYLSIKKIVAWRTNSGLQFSNYKGKEYVTRLAPRGTPDIIGFSNDGRFIGIEVKKPGGIVSEEQQYFIDKLNRSGGTGIIAYSLDDVMNIL